MRLEMANFPVQDMAFGAQTKYDRGTLQVSKEEISRLILDDPRITSLELEVVHPGESTRITEVRDVVDPRVKVKGGGTVFPGFLGTPHNVGSGTTHRLTQTAIIASAQVPVTGMGVGTQTPRGSMIEMSGPGAFTPISRFTNLVLILGLTPGLTDLDYHYAIQMAELKVSKRLAEATVNLKPADVEVFELTPVDPSLPKVVFIQGTLTTAHEPHPGVTFYGMPLREAMPMWTHPNEYFDGAVLVNATRSSGIWPSSWDWLNHPIIRGLYKDHGKRFNFLGVILQRIRFETMDGKVLVAEQTAKLAKAMGADGMISTWMVAGNAFMDVQMTVQACEKLGVKSVCVTYEWGGESGEDPPLLFVLPEAQSMVSTGNSHRFKADGPLKIPQVKRVVGPKEVDTDPAPGSPKASAYEPMQFTTFMGPVYGGVDLWGERSRTCREF